MYKILIAFFLACAFLMYSLHLYSSLPMLMGNESADRGKMIWQKYNCNACHQVYGLGGYLGPDLTNVYSMRREPFIRAIVRSGTKVMPSFYCSDIELDDLIAYLKQIDSSGKSDPRTFTIQANGTIQQ
jgi:nitric oxide reductase subunit C